MRAIGVLLLFAASTAAAEEPAPPAAEPAAPATAPAAPAAPSCEPPCRKGYFCRDGKCVSECNPPCPSGSLCRDRECVADPNASRAAAPRSAGEDPEGKKELIHNSFVGLGGGMRYTVTGSGPTDLPSATLVGIDTGSRYLGGGIALSFPEGGIVIITELIRVQVPFNVVSHLFIEPQFGIAFNYGSFEDFAYQQITLVPGVRARYDLTSAFAVYVQPVRLDIAVYTTVDHADPALDGRLTETQVNASTTAGVQVRY